MNRDPIRKKHIKIKVLKFVSCACGNNESDRDHHFCKVEPDLILTFLISVPRRHDKACRDHYRLYL